MPYANPFREERFRLMQDLLRTIDKLGKCELSWMLGWGGIRWGSTEEALMRMLKQLEKARMIDIDIERNRIISLHPTPPEPGVPPAETKTIEGKRK